MNSVPLTFGEVFHCTKIRYLEYTACASSRCPQMVVRRNASPDLESFAERVFGDALRRLEKKSECSATWEKGTELARS